ncbi:hypothetical protein H0H92_011831 [Tricholoma furcatifolium]|nr:hypothetical protein H0H92_011831 [Tricholoma furcatifolium]
MSFISIYRIVSLNLINCSFKGLALLLGLVILGLASHWTQITTSLLNTPTIYDFEIVALLAGALTALILPVMLVVGAIRKGAFTTMIAVELPTLTVIWVLFLVIGALTAQWKDVFYPFGCGDTFDLSTIQQGWCNEFYAIFGLSFVVWIILFLYTVILLIFSLIGQSRGNVVWTTSVSEANFFATREQGFNPGLMQGGSAAVYQNTGATTMYQNTGIVPPMPMQQYPSSPALLNNGLPQV